MTSAGMPVPAERAPQLAGQTVVVIGGSAGIGLETARRARAEGADIVLAGRNPDRLEQAAAELGARRTAAFDANDAAAVRKFFQDQPAPIDHVMVTAGGPRYGPMLEMDAAQVRHAMSDRVLLSLEVARNAAVKMRPQGTLLLMGGTGARRVGPGLGIAAAVTAMLPPFTAALALELAPVRVNLIAAGFVDTALSASLLGDRLEERREELRATLPIGRVVGPADVAALAVHIMTNTALTGATYDIDGGQQFVSLCTAPEPSPCRLNAGTPLVLMLPQRRNISNEPPYGPDRCLPEVTCRQKPPLIAAAFSAPRALPPLPSALPS
jgi:NAD(P)-dependent dehydrogenase (short-subunit alcohol dehydrogenase family)